MAPFGGTVVYRHPSPALAEDDQVILALAKGAGFLATVQVPAREAAMLAPGQELRMKLNHSLVSEEIIGRLQSVQLVSGYPNRRDLLIACDLPPEQFAALSKGTIPVTLQWRPPLYTDRFAQAGLVFLMLSVVAWLLTQATCVGTPDRQLPAKRKRLSVFSHNLAYLLRSSWLDDDRCAAPSAHANKSRHFVAFLDAHSVLGFSWPSTPHIGFAPELLN